MQGEGAALVQLRLERDVAPVQARDLAGQRKAQAGARDLGNAVVRDLLLTGRSFNVTKAQQIGLVSQVVGEGQALRVARATAAQLAKLDRGTAATAKKFMKPVPYDELRQEIEIVCELYARPQVQAALKKFVESTDAQPYLP